MSAGLGLRLLAAERHVAGVAAWLEHKSEQVGRRNAKLATELEAAAARLAAANRAIGQVTAVRERRLERRLKREDAARAAERCRQDVETFAMEIRTTEREDGTLELAIIGGTQDGLAENQLSG